MPKQLRPTAIRSQMRQTSPSGSLPHAARKWQALFELGASAVEACQAMSGPRLFAMPPSPCVESSISQPSPPTSSRAFLENVALRRPVS